MRTDGWRIVTARLVRKGERRTVSVLLGSGMSVSEAAAWMGVSKGYAASLLENAGRTTTSCDDVA